MVLNRLLTSYIFPPAAPPRITVFPPNPSTTYTVEVGRLVGINCQIDSVDSEASVSAFRIEEGSAVELPDVSSQFVPIVQTEFLSGQGVTPDDDGVYLCVSNNTAGNDTVDVIVDVLGIGTNCYRVLEM